MQFAREPLPRTAKALRAEISEWVASGEGGQAKTKTEILGLTVRQSRRLTASVILWIVLLFVLEAVGMRIPLMIITNPS